MDSALTARFRAPGHDDRPAVMWFWNDRISKEGIRLQLAEFRRQGFTDFYVHPLWGSEFDYLSDEFFALVRHAVAVARELGMYYHIYDEYNWPSGSAGGKLTRAEPWTKSKKLVCTGIPLFSGQPVDRVLSGALVSAQAVYADRQAAARDVTQEISAQPAEGGVRIRFVNDACSGCTLWVCCAAPSDGLATTGMWSKFSRFETGMLDTNNPRAVRRFIEYTHERYKAAVGEEFGKTVRGVFTDEVSTMLMFDRADGVYPWTDALPAEFEAEHGYALAPRLHELMHDEGDGALKLRHDYWQTVSRLFHDGFLRQTADWCRENNLVYTGHLSGEGILYWHAFQMGDFFKSISELEVPGIDSILSKLCADDPAFAIEAALVSSAAKFCGRRRVMCETFSGSGWDMTIAEMKRILHKLALQGVNYFVFMGAYYSLDGARKRMPLGYPPSHGYNNPLFKHYGILGDYTGRLCALSAGTVPEAGVLVLLPQQTQYMDAENMGGHDRAWRAVAQALISDGVGFDLLFEPLSPEAAVRGREIELRGCRYDTLVVPGARWTDEATASLLERFGAAGGRLLFVNRVPERAVDTGRALCLMDAPPEGSDGQFQSHSEGSRAFCRVDRGDGAGFGAFREFLYGFVRGEARPIALDAPRAGVLAAHRRADGLDLFLVANDTAGPLCARGSLAAPGGAFLLDLETGERRPLALAERGGRRRFELTLPGYGLAAIACREGWEEAGADQGFAPGSSAETLSLDGSYAFTAEGGNLLPLRMKLACNFPALLKAAERGDAQALADLAQAGGAPESAPQELPGGSGLAFGDPYAAIAFFEARGLTGAVELFAEREEGMDVYLNGRRLESFEPCRLWGERGARARLEPGILKDRNSIVAVSRIPAWAAPHAIPTLFLRGDFLVLPGDALAAPARGILPDSWTTQGYPYFSGDGAYETEFELGRFSRVLLRVDTADVARVFVNGADAGRAAWQPYEFDITAHARAGKNALRLVFTSTYSNFMDIVRVNLVRQGVTEYAETPGAGRSGLLAPARLSIYREEA